MIVGSKAEFEAEEFVCRRAEINFAKSFAELYLMVERKRESEKGEETDGGDKWRNKSKHLPSRTVPSKRIIRVD